MSSKYPSGICQTVDGMFLRPKGSHRKTLTESALKSINNQLTRSRGDISSIKYVKLIDKDTETEQGLQTVMLLISLPKLRQRIHL